MTAGAGMPATARPAAFRWLAAAIIALPAAIAVLMLSGGDVLVAYGRAPQAARLPGNSVLPGEAILAGMAEGAVGAVGRATALDVLGSAPLSARALAYLASDTAEQEDAGKRGRLRAIAGKIGWHDEWTQRRLYNAALVAGDSTSALRHADDALLRQQFAREELYTQFVRGMNVPEFRADLGRTIAKSPHWPREFLVQHGSELSDAALLELVTARAKAQGGLDRGLAAPLVTRLVSLGRLEAASAIWELVPGHRPPGAGDLEWPDEAAEKAPTPFDWNVPAAYSIEHGDGAWLVAGTAMPGEFASRLIVLPPGDYRILASEAEGWLWGAGCADTRVVPSRSLSADTGFVIAGDCAAATLAIMPAPGGAAAALARLVIERRPDRAAPGSRAR